MRRASCGRLVYAHQEFANRAAPRFTRGQIVEQLVAQSRLALALAQGLEILAQLLLKRSQSGQLAVQPLALGGGRCIVRCEREQRLKYVRGAIIQPAGGTQLLDLVRLPASRVHAEALWLARNHSSPRATTCRVTASWRTRQGGWPERKVSASTPTTRPER